MRRERAYCGHCTQEGYSRQPPAEWESQRPRREKRRRWKVSLRAKRSSPECFFLEEVDFHGTVRVWPKGMLRCTPTSDDSDTVTRPTGEGGSEGELALWMWMYSEGGAKGVVEH